MDMDQLKPTVLSRLSPPVSLDAWTAVLVHVVST